MSGTQQTWTVASSSSFPSASTGTSQFHVADISANSEIIAVTNVSGNSWTVTRGAEGTTPVVHASGFTVFQVTTAGWLNSALVNPMTTLGDTTYGGTSGTGTRLAGNTAATKKFFTQTGTGSVSAAPAWGTIAAADIPAGTAGQVLATNSSGAVAWAHAPVAWYNVVTQYGADPTGSADSTTAIQNAINAANAAAGGVVYLPAGTYKTSGVTMTTSNVSLQGDGAATIIAPTTGNTAITTSTGSFTANYQISDMSFSLASGSLGIQANGAGASNFQNLWFTGSSAAGGVSINGDDTTEQNWVNCTFASVGGTAFAYTRTTTTVNGGIYMNRVRCVSPPSSASAHGFAFTSAAGQVTEIDIWMEDCVADSYYGDALYCNNVSGLKAYNLWATLNASVTSGHYPIHLTNCLNMNFLGGYAYQPLSSSFVMLLDGNTDTTYVGGEMWLDGVSSGNAIGLNAAFGIKIGEVRYTAPSLTDAPWVASSSSGQAARTPYTILTQGNNTSAQAFAIDDANNIGSQVWLRNNAGQLQFRNTAFNATIAALSQSGQWTANQMLSGLTGGGSISQGSGAPSKPNGVNPAAGDIYFRTDTPSTANQRIYICTTGGGSPVWSGIV